MVTVNDWSPFPAGSMSPTDPFVAPAGECRIDDAVGSWSSGTLHLDARDVSSGEQLVGIRSGDAAATGSTMKLLTAAAAVATLGGDTTIETRVVQGTEVDTVVLVGGGDPTLSRLPSGQESVYPGAPHLDDLARQVLDARSRDPRLAGVPVRRLEVDAGLFSGPAWQPGWPDSARTSGSVSNITALMVDGDRDDPTRAYSPRGDSAVGRAATAFAALLGSDVTVGGLVDAPDDAERLGSVHSAPVRDLVRHLLTHSDNTLAESLARLVAIERGAGSDFEAIDAGTTGALADLGLPVDDLRLADGSGLSRDDAVPAAFVTRLLVEIARHRDDLSVVDEGLAVAGRTGTLAEDGRFSTENADAAGRIRAKSGTLSDMSGLAGIADAADGTTIAFTIWAEDTPPGAASTDARAAVDALAAEVFRCGAAL
ncbi:D-alanyl-D-alanine carboxypeptidase [Labedella populi]|uniref:D-alanyl-D-alanine carboxypeptidase n=2 Tax=Labedella populi TaxID=2498850 RepID=A0A3S5CJ23_9MICO|nr:D-alanyl-D-alanine carboxypeptidase [Labedella populi]